jgi:hypothetical protein
MTSVQSYIKQQNILWAASPTASNITLYTFVRSPFNPSNPNSTQGYFEPVQVSVNSNGGNSNLTVFRDMGQSIISAGRTFRRIQKLSPGSQATQPNTFGVAGEPSTGPAVTDYQTYYYENSILSGGCEYTNQLFRIQ